MPESLEQNLQGWVGLSPPSRATVSTLFKQMRDRFMCESDFWALCEEDSGVGPRVSPLGSLPMACPCPFLVGTQLSCTWSGMWQFLLSPVGTMIRRVTPALPASGPCLLLRSPGSLGCARSCRHLTEAESVQKLPVYSFTVYSSSVGIFWSFDCSCVYMWG